ncbi:hypothetical protein BIV60_11970 [Bacillus sp. MUM 116]|uniref:hypothetical protein n=1 Tax=Bacillus sp. MUM 116 TaxID=1678002 RepID=UPI0008F58633|nr:hypothetical protein [Bacillus sp. MUM 116]OIK14219.1 hypothetical protein BIV60_11970 [Bacillus sp. MUM 116]
MKKSTKIVAGVIGGFLLILILTVTFGRTEEKPKQATHSTKSTQTAASTTSSQKDIDSNSKTLEQFGMKEKNITDQENVDVEEIKKVTLNFFHLFDEKSLSGQDAVNREKALYDQIKQQFSQDSLKQYTPQQIAQFYQRINLYSSIGDGNNKLLDLKLINLSIEMVDYNSEYKVYSVAVKLTTNQNTGMLGVVISNEGGIWKINYTPNAKFKVVNS